MLTLANRFGTLLNLSRFSLSIHAFKAASEFCWLFHYYLLRTLAREPYDKLKSALLTSMIETADPLCDACLVALGALGCKDCIKDNDVGLEILREVQQNLSAQNATLLSKFQDDVAYFKTQAVSTGPAILPKPPSQATS